MQTSGAPPPAYQDLSKQNPNSAYPDLAKAQQQAVTSQVSYGQPQVQQPQPVQYQQQPQPIVQQVAGAQQMVYMIQNPDGSLVPMQGGQQQQVIYQQQVGGVSYVSNPYSAGSTVTTTVVNGFGSVSSIPGSQTIITTNGALREPVNYNRNTAGWGLFIVILAWICDIYSLAADELLTYHPDDTDDSSWYDYDIFYTHDRLLEDGWWYLDDETTYSSLCDENNEDEDIVQDINWCTIESKGSTYQAFRIIGNISLAIGVISISNVIFRCWHKEQHLNYVRLSGGCALCTLICIVISMLVFLVNNEAMNDNSQDVEWAQSMYGNIIEIVILFFAPFLLCQSRKPLE